MCRPPPEERSFLGGELLLLFFFCSSAHALEWAAPGRQMGWVEGSKGWLAEEDWEKEKKKRKREEEGICRGGAWLEAEAEKLSRGGANPTPGSTPGTFIVNHIFYSGYHSIGCLCCFMCSFIHLCCWFFLCSMDPAWETDKGLRLIHHETPEIWVAVWFWLCICFFPLIWTHFSFHRRHSLNSIFIHRNLVFVPEISTPPLVSPTW